MARLIRPSHHKLQATSRSKDLRRSLGGKFIQKLQLARLQSVVRPELVEQDGRAQTNILYNEYFERGRKELARGTACVPDGHGASAAIED